jgi:UDP-N-acetylmuramate--alanine ligase
MGMAGEPCPHILANADRVHLVGIGGSGMRSLAILLAAEGKRISGSDLSAEAVAQLASQGIETSVGHRAEQLGRAEAVIVSAAIPADNAELLEARRRGLPVLTHAAALGELMQPRFGVAVAGTHGKTTTTAMLGHILARAGLDPTVLVGATVLNLGSGARPGRGAYLVVEADEYDRRFLALRPRLVLITGIEADHLDYFRDLEEIVDAFRAFADRLGPDGLLITCADDPVLAGIDLPRRRLSYGRASSADWRLTAFHPRPGGGCEFGLDGPSGAARVELQLSGLHNATNAAGAIAASCTLGVPLDGAAAAVADFRGTERRFQTVWRAGGIWIVDDYAHHPSEVRATLAAAREVHRGRLWAVFQPHTTNRVAELREEFGTSFVAADRLTLLPIYRPPGRERGERAVTAADLASAISRPPPSLAASLEAAEEDVAGELRPGDLAVVMGAGDVTLLSRGLARRLARREPVP